MSDFLVMVSGAVVGAFLGQFLAGVLFPAVSLAEKNELLAWMKCQEDINRLIRERVDRLEALARQVRVVTGEMLKPHLSSGAIEPLDLRNNGDKK